VNDPDALATNIIRRVQVRDGEQRQKRPLRQTYEGHVEES
jgi:hypothetical protein